MYAHEAACRACDCNLLCRALPRPRFKDLSGLDGGPGVVSLACESAPGMCGIPAMELSLEDSG